MSIANRVGALVAAAMLVLLAVGWLVMQTIILPGFESMDDLHAREEIKRVQAEFDNEQELLDRFATDWSAWDDAYRFAKDRNADFIAANLETKVMLDQHISLMWFVDLEGKTIWGRALNPDQSTPKPHPTFPGPTLATDNPLIGLKEPDIGLKGILETPLGLMTVASRPIVTSHFQGPLRGYLIVGKLLDGRRFSDIGQRLGVRLSGAPAALLPPGSTEAQLLASLIPGDISLVLHDGGGSLNAYATMFDLAGHPALLLKTEYERKHLLLGQETLRIALLVLASSGILLMALAYLALRFYVSRPLSQLVLELKNLKSLDSNTPSLQSEGKGEVAKVTREVKGMLDRIAYLSHTDTLTGLPNRASFKVRAQHALALAKRHETMAALLLLDLDGFKEVNDTLGHEAGDRLLVAMTERLKLVLRESDTLARFGGDEFLILAENLPAITGAADLARRILAIFEQPLIPEDIRHGQSCSIGISVFPDDAQTIEDLLRMADIAMYRAKSSGGNTWRCHAESLECHHNQEHEKGRD
jgi:diguanylate cyclase (GGDEF)-like protein